MKKQEAIEIIDHTIEQLRAYDYQWAVERADDLEGVRELIDYKISDSPSLDDHIYKYDGKPCIDMLGYIGAKMEMERETAQRAYDREYEKALAKKKEEE